MNWPGNSPDLNPIEYLLPVMKAKNGRSTSSSYRITEDSKKNWVGLRN